MDNDFPENANDPQGPAHKLRSLDAKRTRMASDLHGASQHVASALRLAHELAMRTKSAFDKDRLRDVEAVVAAVEALRRT